MLRSWEEVLKIKQTPVVHCLLSGFFAAKKQLTIQEGGVWKLGVSTTKMSFVVADQTCICMYFSEVFKGGYGWLPFV